jgi:hypothetical protein
MLRFLSWNVRDQSLLERVTRLVHRHDIDVLIVIESSDSPIETLAALNSLASSPFRYAPGVSPSIRVYVRFPTEYVTTLREGPRFSIRSLQLPARDELLLATVHLPSLLHMTRESQMAEMFELSIAVRDTENQQGHRRTILIGDLNADPFSDGVVSAAGLNAVMTQDIARRGSRRVRGREYPFFYNPMWGFFGDRTHGPSGSYYYDAGDDVQHFWHTIDQVLIRPALLNGLGPESVSILSSDGQAALVRRNGRPDGRNASDHLPLLFQLEI